MPKSTQTRSITDMQRHLKQARECVNQLCDGRRTWTVSAKDDDADVVIERALKDLEFVLSYNQQVERLTGAVETEKLQSKIARLEQNVVDERQRVDGERARNNTLLERWFDAQEELIQYHSVVSRIASAGGPMELAAWREQVNKLLGTPPAAYGDLLLLGDIQHWFAQLVEMFDSGHTWTMWTQRNIEAEVRRFAGLYPHEGWEKAKVTTVACNCISVTGEARLQVGSHHGVVCPLYFADVPHPDVRRVRAGGDCAVCGTNVVFINGTNKLIHYSELLNGGAKLDHDPVILQDLWT